MELLTVIFWYAIAVLFLLTAATESFFVGFIVLFLSGAWIAFVEGVDILAYAQENTGTILVFLLVYVACGAIWSLVKWRLWLGKQKDGITRAWDTFQLNNPSLTGDMEAMKNDFLRSSYGYTWRAANNKGMILSWLVWWVPSLAWTVFKDLLIKVWERVYDLLSGVYDRISSAFIRNIIK